MMFVRAMTDLELTAFEVRQRFDRLGYSIFATPVEGSEEGFWEEMKEAVRKLEAELEWVQRHFKVRGRSKRALSLLHKYCPHPTWGVRPRITYDKR